MDCLVCFGCWWCCAPCSFAKLFAHSTNGDDCGIVNHCLPVLFCGPFVACITRHNLRLLAGAPPPDASGWIGDVGCVVCCGPCSFCQMLRSVPKGAWNWGEAAQHGEISCLARPCVVCRDY